MLSLSRVITEISCSECALCVCWSFPAYHLHTHSYDPDACAKSPSLIRSFSSLCRIHPPHAMSPVSIATLRDVRRMRTFRSLHFPRTEFFRKSVTHHHKQREESPTSEHCQHHNNTLWPYIMLSSTKQYHNVLNRGRFAIVGRRVFGCPVRRHPSVPKISFCLSCLFVFQCVCVFSSDSFAVLKSCYSK